ncbi:hypothetical protein Golomagni_01226 [Golovinomyces magnicellulatus]|nr:hypothetical protein Golomagni_01226 [Golovinomyces magnicellulatus]
MAIQKSASGIMTRIERWKNQALDPACHQKFRAATCNFARERPFFFFFILTHLLLSATPVLLFLSFVTCTVLLSFTSAILFSLFWIVSAFMVLVSSLILSTSVGMIIWVWGAGSLAFSRWAYNKVLTGDIKSKLQNCKKDTVKEAEQNKGEEKKKTTVHEEYE